MFRRFWMWRLELYCWWVERRWKHKRRKYCRKGFHKLTTCSTTWKEHERAITVRYLKCAYCNFYFFANKSQKDMFLKKEGKAKEGYFSDFLKSLSSAKQKHLKASVGSKRRLASASFPKK